MGFFSFIWSLFMSEFARYRFYVNQKFAAVEQHLGVQSEEAHWWIDKIKFLVALILLLWAWFRYMYMWKIVRNIFFTAENLTAAERAMRDLESRKSIAMNDIEQGERMGQIQSDRAKEWFEKVKEVEAELLKTKSSFHKWGFFVRGCSFNLFIKYQVSKKALGLVENITMLRRELADIELLTTPVPNAGREISKDEIIIGSQINSKLELIHSYIEDDSVTTIGIWGMGGAGKTTLLEAINNEFVNLARTQGAKNSFQHVIVVSVNENHSLEKLRQDVAGELGSVQPTARSIFNFLRNRSFLLLLDNIWEKIDLHAVGIPLGKSIGQLKQMIIFTTRSEQICVKMNAKKTMKVDRLEKEEAWEMFRETVGGYVLADPRIHELGRKVAEACDGLPLAIKTIGRTMATKKGHHQWEHALTSLRKSWSKDIPDIEKDVFSTLKFSYDNLADELTRQCFLYCSLWRQGQSIIKNDLIRCWIGLGLIDEFDDIAEAYNTGLFIIRNLEEACLLEPSTKVPISDLSRPAVKLHDSIRGMALWISSKCGAEKNSWIVEKYGSGEIAKLDKWKDAEVVSVRLGNKVLPCPPDCSKLLTLIMHGTVRCQIPRGFFISMPSLKYLHLSGKLSYESPDEICSLVDLQYLKVAGWNCSELHEAVRQLRSLRYLYIRLSCHISEDFLNALSELPRLEVVDVFPDYEFDLVHLKQLERRGLKSLSMKVSSIETFKELRHFNVERVHMESLKSVRSVKLQQRRHGMDKCLNYLILSKCEDLMRLAIHGGATFREDQHGFPLQNLEELQLEHLPNFVEIVWEGASASQSFRSLRRLCIYKCKSLKSITWVAELPSLQTILVDECEGMEEVVSGEVDEIDDPDKVAFPCLSLLGLGSCPRLHRICPKVLRFPSLEHVNIINCRELRMLPFHPTVAKKKLKCIRGENEWWENLLWEDKHIFEPFFFEFGDNFVRELAEELCAEYEKTEDEEATEEEEDEEEEEGERRCSMHKRRRN